MKIALAADFHLDLRQFNRQQRWIDFVNTFTRVTRKVDQLGADAYVIAGDLFEKYRPHPGVIRRFLREASHLDCPIILIRGNHDSPQVFQEKFGGDTLHLIQDVAETVYLNRENPSYELGEVCFIGLGYTGFNADQEIRSHVGKVATECEIKVGVFHQLLDYPGVPQDRADVSRAFMKNLGLNYVLMGHWHLRYEEEGLFNPGSPEYWSFDQGEQVVVNLDTGEEGVNPSKEKGFYLIDTFKERGEYIEVQPARPMHCITFKTDSFNEAIHLSEIQRYLKRFNTAGVMVKTVIEGRCKHGRIALGKKIELEKPLIHNVVTDLQPSKTNVERINVIEAQAEYLAERGIGKEVSKHLAEWLEHHRNDLALMQSNELLSYLRSILDPGEGQSESDSP